MLDVGTNDSCGIFGAQGQRLSVIAFRTPAVFPGIHLLCHDVGIFTHAAGEQLRGLENRRADFLEVVGAEHIAHSGLHEVPQRRLRREQIAGASNGFNHVGRWSLVDGRWPLVVQR